MVRNEMGWDGKGMGMKRRPTSILSQPKISHHRIGKWERIYVRRIGLHRHGNDIESDGLRQGARQRHTRIGPHRIVG
eukprot:5015288-Pyramimonas_sp.AAC.1